MTPHDNDETSLATTGAEGKPSLLSAVFVPSRAGQPLLGARLEGC